MNYRTMDNVKISEIGFGAWAIGKDKWGSDVNDKDSADTLEKALEVGINFFDTADAYGDGKSEELIGDFIQNKRDRIVLASKGGIDITKAERNRDFSAAYLESACNASLQRMRTDYMDVYQLHNPSMEDIEKGEIFQILETLKKSGKIRLGGLSLWNPPEIERALELADFDVLQVNFNILRQDNLDVIRKAHAKGVSVIVNQPLAAGMLTGKYSKTSKFAETDHRGGYWTDEMFDGYQQKLDLVKDYARAPFTSMAQVALAFVLGFEEVTCTITGAKRPTQIAETAAASGKELSSEQFESLLD